MLLRVDRVLLRVPHLESAVRYYRDVLGMKPLRQEAQVASFALGEGELVLHADVDLPAEATYYRVEDVRDLYRRREALSLSFVQQPAPSTRGWRAAVKDPFGNVLLLIDRTSETSGGERIEDARLPGALFPGIEPRVPAKREMLVALYGKIGRTADDLPYTPHFETLYSSYAALHDPVVPTRKEVWRHLLNLRKGGKLPRLGAARSIPPEISADDKALLIELVGEEMGRRDRLPYTRRFNGIVDAFNQARRRPLSPHLVWRLVATLAK